jgi:hypothetical protein
LAAAQPAVGDNGVVIAGKRPMILHSDRPEDLESPCAYFDTWLTPVDSLADLKALPHFTVPIFAVWPPIERRSSRTKGGADQELTGMAGWGWSAKPEDRSALLEFLAANYGRR